MVSTILVKEVNKLEKEKIDYKLKTHFGSECMLHTKNGMRSGKLKNQNGKISKI